MAPNSFLVRSFVCDLEERCFSRCSSNLHSHQPGSRAAESHSGFIILFHNNSIFTWYFLNCESICASCAEPKAAANISNQFTWLTSAHYSLLRFIYYNASLIYLEFLCVRTHFSSQEELKRKRFNATELKQPKHSPSAGLIRKSPLKSVQLLIIYRWFPQKGDTRAHARQHAHADFFHWEKYCHLVAQRDPNLTVFQ